MKRLRRVPYSDLAVRQSLTVLYLGSDLLARIRVIQLIVIFRSTVVILVFRKFPEQGIDACADPCEMIAALIAGIQLSVVVYGVEFVFLGGIVPYAGINDHLIWCE